MNIAGKTLEKNFASLTLRTTLEPGDYSGYPFSVSLEVEYRLEKSRFLMKFTITNKGDKTAPVALGWHPYFSLGGKIDDHRLLHRGTHFVAVDEKLIPTGELLPVEGSPFHFESNPVIGNRILDIALTACGEGQYSVSFKDKSLKLEYDPSFFTYTQLYTPDERMSIAVEPVSAATNAFNQPELGLIKLMPTEKRKAGVCIRLVRRGIAS